MLFFTRKEEGTAWLGCGVAFRVRRGKGCGVTYLGAAWILGCGVAISVRRG
jgi:hypothetical protein